MAPSIVDSAYNGAGHLVNETKTLKNGAKQKPRFTPGYSVPEPAPVDYEFKDLKPCFPDVHWPPLAEVPYSDKGLLGDPEYTDLFAGATDVIDYNPKIGTEVLGVSLKTLTDAQKNDLARLVAHRGVVWFRNQADFTIEDQLELGRYFGTLHKHATTSMPKRKGLEEVHVIYTDGSSKDQRAVFTPSHLWHSDVRSN